MEQNMQGSPASGGMHPYNIIIYIYSNIDAKFTGFMPQIPMGGSFALANVDTRDKCDITRSRPKQSRVYKYTRLWA